MEKPKYSYVKSKRTIAALILTLVGALQATVALVTNLVAGDFTALSIVFALLVIGSCVFTALSLTGRTVKTIPALIVAAVAFVGSSVVIFIDNVGTYSRFYYNTSTEVLLAAFAAGLLYLAAWLLMILGNGKINKGIRNRTLIVIGFIAVCVVAFGAAVVQTGLIYNGNNAIVVPNISANVGTVCTAVAFLILSRVKLNEQVIEAQETVANESSADTANNETVAADQDATAQAPSEKPASERTENIAINVLLTVVTFGIYGFIWFYRNAKRVRKFCGESEKGCADELLLYIFGGVLYRAYWYYTRAKQLNAVAKEQGYDNVFLSPTLQLLLAILMPTELQLAFLTASFNKLDARLNGVEEQRGVANDEARVYLADRQGLLETVLLSIVTCGVYFMITKVRIANRIKLMQGKKTANTSQLVCLLLVPFYWIYWLVSNKGKYRVGSNEATLQAWLMLIIPMYSVYWLITRTDELRLGAEQFGVVVTEQAVWTLLFVAVVPQIAYANMLINLNKVADKLA